MTSLTEILAAVAALSDDERMALTNCLAFGVEPIEPVPVTIEEDKGEGTYTVTLPDGTKIEDDYTGVIFEVDHAMRFNSTEPDADERILRSYQGDADFDTVAWVVHVGDKVIPVTLPDGWRATWL